jgi:hypothetical protein
MKTLKPYNSGKQILVEDCQQVSISTYLNKAKEKLKKELVAAEIEMANLHIELTPSKTAFGGIRYWFKCPKCVRRAGTLFVHPLTGAIGCRKCLSLEYRSRRYKGMVEMGQDKLW